MFIHIHGNLSDPLAVILHPMGITGEKMFDIVGSKLGKCCVISPDMATHGDEKQDFISQEQEAASLHSYLLSRGVTHISLLYGASLGCTVALKLLDYHDITIEAVYLDGAPVARLGIVMRTILPPVLVSKKRSVIKNREKGISGFVQLYGRDIGEHMGDTIKGMSDVSLSNIGKACVVGNTPKLTEEMQRRIWFHWGEKELYTKKSAPLVKRIYPCANVIIRSGFDHCEFMAKKTEEYSAFLRSLLEQKPTH